MESFGTPGALTPSAVEQEAEPTGRQRLRGLLVGQVFNQLTVLKHYWPTPVFGKKRLSVCDCVCSCGKHTCVTAKNLRNGITRSCGCLRRTRSRERRAREAAGIGTDGALAQRLLSAKRSDAKGRNLPCTLTHADIQGLMYQPCSYCGRAKQTEGPISQRPGAPLAKYNGIDRVDNAKGYVIDNCVPCCADCNRMKLTKPVDDFLALVRLIAERHPV